MLQAKRDAVSVTLVLQPVGIMPTAPPIYPPCPKCGMPMRLALIEPLDVPGLRLGLLDEPRYEKRVYECPSCKNSADAVVKLD